MADILDFGGVRVLTSNGLPGAGYVAEFYETGTTTPKTVYSSADLGTPLGTSVTADAAGRFVAVWSSGGLIKCIIKDDLGATVQTIDPVLSVSGTASGASSVTFDPTVELPFTNVQDAIVGAATSAASGFATYGIGITGNATLIANIDATNTGAGLYRFDNTTTGTYPTGVAAADTGLVEHWRQAAGTGMMFLFHATTDRVFHRRLASGSWGTWREVTTINQGAVEGDTLYRTASAWTRLAKGTAGQFLKMNTGATAPEWGGVDPTVVGINTTTGAATVGPWALPAGVKQFTVTSNKSSLGGAGNMLVQLRVAGSFVTSGYESESLLGGGTQATSTAGMVVSVGSGPRFWKGSMTFILHDPATNLWMATHSGSESTAGTDMVTGAGFIALAGAVDGVQINSTTGTYDVASFNVQY
jgi:hypothetical protein